MKSKMGSAPYIVWVLIFTIIPIIMVIVFAFTTRDGNPTFQNFSDMLIFMPTIVDSLLIALIATVICLLLGYPVAYILSHKTQNVQKTMVMLIMLPMWMNFLLRTYAWMTILENNGILNGILKTLHLPTLQLINTRGAVILGMIYAYLPFLILPIYNVLIKIDEQVLNAARDLGAAPRQVFFKVVMPLSIPGVISGINMVFVPAVSTFIISELLGGGKTQLVGDLINEQFMNADNPNLGAAISLVMMVLIVISLGIMSKADSEMETSMI